VSELTQRLRDHAAAHEYIASADEEQQQWAEDLKEAAERIERLEKAVKEWRDRCTKLLNFIEHAPVSSGVCCCGEDMENHVSSDHSPFDQWSWSVHHWSREIETALSSCKIGSMSLWQKVN
jgi:hypothetical protein